MERYENEAKVEKTMREKCCNESRNKTQKGKKKEEIERGEEDRKRKDQRIKYDIDVHVGELFQVQKEELASNRHVLRYQNEGTM